MLLCPGIDTVQDKQGGEPCFAGTQLPVRIVAGLAKACGPGEARRTYPQITAEQVNLALAFMAGREREAESYDLPKPEPK